MGTLLACAKRRGRSRARAFFGCPARRTRHATRSGGGRTPPRASAQRPKRALCSPPSRSCVSALAYMYLSVAARLSTRRSGRQSQSAEENIGQTIAGPSALVARQTRIPGWPERRAKKDKQGRERDRKALAKRRREDRATSAEFWTCDRCSGIPVVLSVNTVCFRFGDCLFVRRDTVTSTSYRMYVLRRVEFRSAGRARLNLTCEHVEVGACAYYANC